MSTQNCDFAGYQGQGQYVRSRCECHDCTQSRQGFFSLPPAPQIISGFGLSDPENLKAVAKLHENAAVLAERERCAKIAETEVLKGADATLVAREIAERIRSGA